ncbi:hypothetical protein ILUMI_24174 [Ignelater luminosus]|uniref:Peptidase S1 domain-containing protein n=1 Tax=Ignelater luminosus TaxID=2038154 RepID=A0A8K0C7H6_IGNLU|nr:hypothetical protein ILUMI_24174 [Ignelater luminosus]
MFRKSYSLLCVLLYFSCTFAKEVKTDLLPGRDVCGKQEEQQRIYGGEEAGIGEFPWLVLLNSSEIGFLCGGALISKRYVLTAAHCIDDTIVSVRLGEHNIDTEEDCEGDTPGLDLCSDPPIDVEVEEIFTHDNFDLENEKMYGDIALIRLKKEVEYTNFIKPICLPTYSEIRDKVLTGEKVFASGWGKTKKTVSLNNVKHKVELPVVSTHDCAQHFKKFGMFISGSQICAGGEKGRDTCQGDSGGPLMYLDKSADKENWVTVGIVSYGIKCGPELRPGVYTRVTEFLDWISERMRP